MKIPASYEIERVFLASIIKHPQVIPDYLERLGDDLVHNDVHKIILGSIRHEFKNKKTVDITILANHVTNIGLASQDGTDIPDYIRTIVRMNSVTEDKIDTYFKECYKYKIARAGVISCQNTIKEIHSNLNQPISTIIAAMEKGMALSSTASEEDDDTFVDVYEGLDEMVENIAERETPEGVYLPFKTWNRWWGPLTKGDFHVIVAPPKTGKSTILNWIADAPFILANKDKKIKVLILDTELESFRVRTRKVASMSQVNECYIKDGKWAKSSEMVEKVTSQFPKFSARKGKIYHRYVANIPIDKVCRIIKRWKAVHTDPDDECVVIYDYLKITGEKIDDSNKEYQVMGEKCDTLKHLMAELGLCGVAAVQSNAANDVAMSQRIKWFASNIYLFRRKTSEELAEHGDQFGTHVIQPFALRNQGADWEEEEFVKQEKEKGTVWNPNWLNISVKNFAMKEAGTRADVIEHLKKQIDLEEPDEDKPKRGRKKSSYGDKDKEIEREELL